MSDSLRPHELQPTRLLRPQDPPGKSTGVGCHCLLQKHQRRHPKPLLLPQGSGIFGGSLKQQVPNGFEENKIHHYHSNIPSQPPEINTDSKCGQQFMHIILYKTWGNFLQYSCLENPMDGGAWQAAVHGVAKLGTTEQLHFHFSLSRIGEGNGNPLQCSCLENPRDEGAWWAAVYGVTQSRTRLKRLSSSSSSREIFKRQYIL